MPDRVDHIGYIFRGFTIVVGLAVGLGLKVEVNGGWQLFLFQHRQRFFISPQADRATLFNLIKLLFIFVLPAVFKAVTDELGSGVIILPGGKPKGLRPSGGQLGPGVGQGGRGWHHL